MELFLDVPNLPTRQWGIISHYSGTSRILYSWRGILIPQQYPAAALFYPPGRINPMPTLEPKGNGPIHRATCWPTPDKFSNFLPSHNLNSRYDPPVCFWRLHFLD